MVSGIEQKVVFKMSRYFNLQRDPGARERGQIIESEFYFNFVWRCHSAHITLNSTACVSERQASRMTAGSRARYRIQSGHLAGLVFRIELERAGSDFSEPLAAAQTDGECDQLVLTAKFEPSCGHTSIDLADMQRR